MTSNKLEVTKATDIEVLTLLDVEIVDKTDVIQAFGKTIVARPYLKVRPDEPETDDYHAWDKSNEIVCKRAEEFMADFNGAQVKSGIPYGIVYDEKGGMIITPMPQQEEKK